MPGIWTEDEDRLLWEGRRRDDRPASSLATEVGRTAGAVRARLAHLGDPRHRAGQRRLRSSWGGSGDDDDDGGGSSGGGSGSDGGSVPGVPRGVTAEEDGDGNGDSFIRDVNVDGDEDVDGDGDMDVDVGGDGDEGVPASKRRRTDADGDGEATAAQAQAPASVSPPVGDGQDLPASGRVEVVIDDDTDAVSDSDSGAESEGVEFVSPPRAAAPLPDPAAARAGGGDDDDDEIIVQSCNVTNPSVHLPHTRDQCGVHRFALTEGNGLGRAGPNLAKCPKCYCYVCDRPAGECDKWEQHCDAHPAHPVWAEARRTVLEDGRTREAGASASPSATAAEGGLPPSTAAFVPPAAFAEAIRAAQRGRIGRATVAPPPHGPTGGDVPAEAISDFLRNLYGSASGSAAAAAGMGGGGRPERVRPREQMSVREVLSENFRRALALGSAAADGGAGTGTEEGGDGSAPSPPDPQSAQSRRKMEGDIPQLGLHSSFYVEGIKIGWPFPMVMQPQRQMAIHLIKALKNRRHVVLESPTGTGKSAAILCSALAWQRYHAKISGGGGAAPRIVYCSRTHSQVAQMVASLKKTPYRPKMAILGSRERMCVHRDLRPRAGAARGGDGAPPTNVNHECRVRVRNTEKYRKKAWRSMAENYDDDDPPEVLPGDRSEGQAEAQADREGAGDGDDFQSKDHKMCPHYRQLTTNRTATLAHTTFVPNEKAVSCCSVGGEETKFGAHDIEDLVNFAVSPHTISGVALYRGESSSIGLQLTEGPGTFGCRVGVMKENGSALVEGTLRVGDRIKKLNGKDVSNLPLSALGNHIRGSNADPVVLDVVRGNDHITDESGYSSHSACPYYLSQILSQNAEIVFAPYNYVLDPGIRNALGIELEGAVVVLDEAHNVEDTLRECGSGKYPEIELYEMIIMMNNYAIMQRSQHNVINVKLREAGSLPNGSEGGGEQQVHLPEVAHTILLFLESLIEFLRASKDRFEQSPGKKGATQTINDWRKYHTPDDHNVEVTYDGPNGRGQNGKAVGCRPFFDRLEMSQNDLNYVVSCAEAIGEYVQQREEQDQTSQNRVDRIIDLVSKFASACEEPEHFYVSSVVSPNGSFAHAAGEDEGASQNSSARGQQSRFKKKPKSFPFAPPRTQAHPNRPANPCSHPICRRKSQGDAFNVVRHGKHCNGSTPKWEAALVLNLLSPGLHMRELAAQCRTIVLASGSLAPLPSLCGELNLFPPKETSASESVKADDDKVGIGDTNDRSRYGRLQVRPRPLEANHVVDLPKQLLAVSIGHFPDGSPLTCTYSNYSKPSFIPKLGDAVASIIERVPSGGVLVFLPSYSFLRKCINAWNPYGGRGGFSRFGRDVDSDVWDRIQASKGKIIVETGGNQEKFEEARNDYNKTIRTTGSCVLLAVFRGKMSEGVSFNDDYARGVICVGMPYPNSFDTSVRAKKDYNDEQRRLNGRKNLLPGQEWYSQQAYRAIAQALGRCIRHASDYGTIVLLDSRHCDDGAPIVDGTGVCLAHRNLPKWMRHHVKNLKKGHRGSGGVMHQFVSNPDLKSIQGGWGGLAQEMKRFFRAAKPHSESVLGKQRAALAKAQERDQKAKGRKFDSNTGTWSSGGPISPASTSSPSNSLVGKASSSVHGSSSSTASARTNSSYSQGARVASQRLTSMERIRRAVPKKKEKPANTLLAMFDRQRNDAAAETSPSGDIHPESTAVSAAAAMPSAPDQNAPSNAHDFSNQSTSTPANLGSALKAVSSQLTATSQAATDEDNLCVICEEEQKSVVLLPCKHLCVCVSCSKLEKLEDCPMCRTPISDKLEVFV